MRSSDYEIVFHDNSPPDALSFIDDGLKAHSESIFGPMRRGALVYLLKDTNSDIVGGVSGYWGDFGWLYIDSLWISETLRGNGLGRRLMELIEAEAIKRGCKHAYLNTMSFQAPEFYKKIGYTIFGELEDFPIGYSRIFLRKKLIDAD